MNAICSLNCVYIVPEYFPEYLPEYSGMFRNIAGIFRNILKTAFRNTGLALMGNGGGGGGGGRFVIGAGPRQGVGGSKPPPVRAPLGKGRRPPVAPTGSTRRPRTTGAPVGVAAGGAEEDAPEGALLVACGVRQGQGFRVEGEAQSDPGWPALVQCLAELARVALWLAPRLRVDLLRLLGRCTVLAERVFATAEDLGDGGDRYSFFGGLGGHDRGRI